jgi:chitosanase
VVALLKDGPGGKRQVTYGKHQTAETGQLGDLLRRYCYGEGYKFGRYKEQLRPFLPHIGKYTLAENAGFVQLLKDAASCEVMQRCQDDYFDEVYWQPAARWFTANGFTLPLSMLVIYDSFIHSGSVPSWLRDDFSEMPPAKGGDERKWITQYVAARDKFLEGNANAAVRGSDYRTDCLLEQVATGNWSLAAPVTCKFNSSRASDWITVA